VSKTREDECFDFVVVGSGPAGACAVDRLLELGKRVCLVDVGDDDEEGLREQIPDMSFEQIRGEDQNQKDYFLGRNHEGVPVGRTKVGSHLTPPRLFVRKRADQELQTRVDGASVMQSLAWGGLGAAWGAGVATFSDSQLTAMGLDATRVNPEYKAVAQRIGISGELGPLISKLDSVQAALPIDENAEGLLEASRSRLSKSLQVGRYALASLSEDRGSRKRNPLQDMDFYGEVRRSVFRPRYLLEELEKNQNLSVKKRKLVLRLERERDCTVLHCKDVDDGKQSVVRGRKVLLAAGAIGTARILLNSGDQTSSASGQPLLSNPYRYWVTLNWRRLGKAISRPRHSLAQLYGLYRDRKSSEPDSVSEIALSFYSYRSLLIFKLVRELPMPAFLGLIFARLLVNSLVIVGVHERGTAGIIKLEKSGDHEPASLLIRAPEPESTNAHDSGLIRELRRLGLIRLSEVRPPWGSSIHYAGSVPIQGSRPARWTCSPDFEVNGLPGVYLADSSGWKELPAKGLTLTIMAHARVLAEMVSR
jgi:choline dehydrogenase-like flavoprotein